MHLETSTNIYGVTTNPWNTDLTPGGSSGGESALVAMRGSVLVSFHHGVSLKSGVNENRGSVVILEDRSDVLLQILVCTVLNLRRGELRSRDKPWAFLVKRGKYFLPSLQSDMAHRFLGLWQLKGPSRVQDQA